MLRSGRAHLALVRDGGSRDWFWSYLSYKRGARLITATGWEPTATAKLERVSAALSNEDRTRIRSLARD